VGGNLERTVIVPDDDCGGDRQGVEQAGVVRRHKVRSGNLRVRPVLPCSSNRARCGGLHAHRYAAEGLIPGIFLAINALVDRV
jgi:hypothetical protein